MNKMVFNLPRGIQWPQFSAYSLSARVGFAAILVSAVLNVLLWTLVFTIFPQKEEAAVLHYSANLGIDFIGQSSQIMVLPGIGTLLLVVNLILGFAIIKADKRATWLIWAMLPVFQIVLLGSFYLIWRANQ